MCVRACERVCVYAVEVPMPCHERGALYAMALGESLCHIIKGTLMPYHEDMIAMPYHEGWASIRYHE